MLRPRSDNKGSVRSTSVALRTRGLRKGRIAYMDPGRSQRGMARAWSNIVSIKPGPLWTFGKVLNHNAKVAEFVPTSTSFHPESLSLLPLATACSSNTRISLRRQASAEATKMPQQKGLSSRLASWESTQDILRRVAFRCLQHHNLLTWAKDDTLCMLGSARTYALSETTWHTHQRSTKNSKLGNRWWRNWCKNAHLQANCPTWNWRGSLLRTLAKRCFWRIRDTWSAFVILWS